MKNANPRHDLPRRAIIARSRPVGIADLSRTGCRLETDEPFAIGEIGMLTVQLDGEPRMEIFRVARVASIAGRHCLFVAGVEFLPLPAEAASLQDVVVQFEADGPLR